VREGVRVEALTELSSASSSSARFELKTSAGVFTADAVVVATGCYQPSAHPRLRGAGAAGVVNLHSSNYKNPESLPDGAVLVVGSGQSGCQIAEDLHLAGRQVHLAVGNAPRCAAPYRGRDVVEWLDDLGYYNMPIDQHPNREQVRDKTNHYVTGRDGGRDIDLRQHALTGMRLYGPLENIAAGQARFKPELKRNLDAADAVYRSINRTIDAFITKQGRSVPEEADYQPPWEPESESETLDLAAERVAAIVWCAGFASDFAWVKPPCSTNAAFPAMNAGSAPYLVCIFSVCPGSTLGARVVSGVGRDATHVVEHLANATKRANPLLRRSCTWQRPLERARAGRHATRSSLSVNAAAIARPRPARRQKGVPRR